MDKQALIQKIKGLDGLTNDEKSDLLGLLRSHKKYGLVWEDKPEDVEERLRDELPVLTEVEERALISDAPDAPNHILIEGDNLEALTALSYTHEGKVDVIYIDPPYNTGNKDFIYNDRFVDSEDAYRHSKWLSFMERRLRIARRLLSMGGVIFISIDDNEQAQLKLLCDEVFVNGYIATLVWKSKSGGANDSKYFAVDHEYILVYSLHPLVVPPFMDNQSEVSTSYNLSDEKGDYSLDRLDKQSIRYSESLDYEITGPDGQIYRPRHKNPLRPNATWRWSRQTVQERFEELVFKNGNVYTKNYRKEANIARSLLFDERFGRTRTGKTELAVIAPLSQFNSPKPSKLIKHLFNISSGKELTILDFFAGSGTTLHATMQLNAEDGGHRKCILVTNNENGICENVTYERNKRVIQGYTTPKGEEVPGLTANTLRYYKTDFISRDRTQRNMHALVEAATDLLCIKEDLYEEQTHFGRYKTHPKALRYFARGSKRMLVLYRDEYTEEVAAEIENIELPQDEKIKIYIFSPDRYAYDDMFENVADKVMLVALPAAIYDAYKKVLPKRKEKLLELATEDKEANEEGGEE